MKRKILLAILQCFIAVGIAAISYPFIMSLGPATHLADIEYKKYHTALEIDVSQMQPRELLQVEWQGYPVGIYRRTLYDRFNIRPSNDPMLEANTSNSLPDWWHKAAVDLDSDYLHSPSRSQNTEFFVFYWLSPAQGCLLKFVAKEQARQYHLPSWWPGGFLDPCYQIAFDLSGRVFKGQGFFQQLLAPPYKLIDSHKIQLTADD